MRRRGVATAVALVVVTAALGACTDDPPAMLGHTATPTPKTLPSARAPVSLDDLPVGRPTAVPWWQRGILHVSTGQLHLRATTIRYSAGTTAVQATTSNGRGWFWVLDRELLPLTTDPRAELFVSSTGSQLVWSEQPRDDQRRLTAWDIGTRSLVATHTEEVEVFCCTGGGDLTLHGMNADGFVVYTLRGHAYAWWPNQGEPLRVRGLRPAPFIAQLWPGGLMYQGQGDVLEVPGVFGTVDREGRFRRAGRTPTDQLGTWSPDGRYFAYVADHLGSAGTKSREAIWVQDTLVDSRTEVNLPPGLDWDVVAWESATEVLLATWGDELDDDVTGVRALVRCDVALGTCERPRGAPSGSVRLPE